MRLTYRTQRRLRFAGLIAALLALLFIIAWFCSVVFLERYVVFTRNGAKLDTSFSANDVIGEVARPPVGDTGITIYYNAGADSVTLGNELTLTIFSKIWGRSGIFWNPSSPAPPFSST